MAAILAEIKSRLLLPKHDESSEDDEDPRAELVRRLQEYEVIKRAAEKIEDLPRVERELHIGEAEVAENCQPQIILPDVDMRELTLALQKLMAQAAAFEHHHIKREALSTRERMSSVLESVTAKKFVSFASLFTIEEGRQGVVVTFLAILELVKLSMLELVQAEPMSDIHVRAPKAEE